MKKSKDMDFGRRASSYDKGIEGKLSRRFYNLLLKEVSLKPQDKLLDVGCGTGALLGRFTNLNTIQGYGIDIAEGMVKEAQKKYPKMTFMVARCDDIPFSDNTFDVVTSCIAYHHYDNKEGFAKEAARVLKPGGLIYIADPHFPSLVRKTMNGLVKLFHVVGEFCTPIEIAERFLEYGFSPEGFTFDGFAQVVKLKRN